VPSRGSIISINAARSASAVANSFAYLLALAGTGRRTRSPARLQFEKFLVLLIQDTCAIGATPGIEIQKRPRFCLRPFRAHLIDDSAVNHFGAYAGSIAGDLDMEFHDGLIPQRVLLLA
jgi:hypothetical protein